MRGIPMGALVLGASLIVALGCKKQGDTELPPPPGWEDAEREEGYDEVDQPDLDIDYSKDDETREEKKQERAGSPNDSGKEPVFAEGMSVQDAVDAASGTERLNIEQEVLGAPLSRPELYEPCKVGPSDHFDLRVAIWEGRAVGIDVETKNETLKQCLIEQVKKVRWKDK